MAAIAHKSGQQQETVYYTTSIGVASARKHDTANALIERANTAVSHAKRCGKNNFQMAV
jgi:PleD family two-component response regulator